MENSKLEMLHKLLPDLIAILMILVCTALILCGHDGAFRNILSALVGYYFGQKATTYRSGE